MGKIPHLSLVASPPVTHGEFYFSPFVASPLMGKNPIPSPYPSFNSSMARYFVLQRFNIITQKNITDFKNLSSVIAGVAIKSCPSRNCVIYKPLTILYDTI